MWQRVAISAYIHVELLYIFFSFFHFIRASLFLCVVFLICFLRILWLPALPFSVLHRFSSSSVSVASDAAIGVPLFGPKAA